MSDNSVEKIIDLIGKKALKFGLKLFKIITESHENAVFSSYSVYSILMLAYLGAKGHTFLQLKKVLHLPQDLDSVRSACLKMCEQIQSDENITLNVVNAMFLSDKLTLNPEFMDSANHYFRTSIQHLNFSDIEESRKIINDWISSNTFGKITQLFKMESIPKDVANIFVNAVYFNGVWSTKFESANTTERDFHVSPTKTVQIPTLHATNIKFTSAFHRSMNCVIAALPYEGNRITMYLLLPGKQFGLADLLKKLNPEKFDYSYLDDVANAKEKPIYLPKFKLESSFDLDEGIQSLGIKDIFNNRSDLSGIAGDPGELKVTQIVQSAMIDVNERGAEGAAATEMTAIMFLNAPLSPPLVINHPFLFLIRDSLTGIILFIGKVVDPSIS